jgi:hypothetical protein
VRYLGQQHGGVAIFKALYTAKEHGWHRFVAMRTITTSSTAKKSER